MNTYKKTTLIILASSLYLPVNAIEIGQVDGVKMNLTLQVNKALMHVDNGTDSDTFFVDNINSSSRFNLSVETELESGDKVGGAFESRYSSNPSHQVSFEEKSISPELSERKMEVWISNELGKLSLGQGDGAANGNTEQDYSKTGVINWHNMALLGGSIAFEEDGPTLSSTMSNLDFESRYDRIRYDLPSFGPVKLSVSQGVKSGAEVSEVGLRFQTKVDSIKLKGALGYSLDDKESGNAAGEETTIGGSLAMIHDSGLNLALGHSASSDDDADNPDADYTSVRLGYIINKHALSVLYAVTDSLNQKDDEHQAAGLGYVYSAYKGIDFYAGYKVHSLDRSGSDFDDVTIVTSGLRIKL